MQLATVQYTQAWIKRRIDFIGVMARNICKKNNVLASSYLPVRIDQLNRLLQNFILMSLVTICLHISISGYVMTEVMQNLQASLRPRRA